MSLRKINYSVIMIIMMALCCGLYSAVPERLMVADGCVLDKRVRDFLEFLVDQRVPTMRYHQNDAPKWDVDKLKGYISSKGLRVSSDGGRRGGLISLDSVIGQIVKRHGSAFNFFSHISYLCSISKKQYSEIKSQGEVGRLRVFVASFYELVFVVEDGQLKLVQCIDVNSEVD